MSKRGAMHFSYRQLDQGFRGHHLLVLALSNRRNHVPVLYVPLALKLRFPEVLELLEGVLRLLRPNAKSQQAKLKRRLLAVLRNKHFIVRRGMSDAVSIATKKRNTGAAWMPTKQWRLDPILGTVPTTSFLRLPSKSQHRTSTAAQSANSDPNTRAVKPKASTPALLEPEAPALHHHFDF